MLRILLLIAVLALAGGGVYLYFFAPAGVSDEPVPVTLHTIRKSAHGSGQLEGNGAVMKLRFPWAGLLDEITVKEGDWVKVGDIVAKLNTTEIDSKIKLQEIAVKEAKAKREALSARKPAEAIEQALADLKTAEAFRARMEAILEQMKTPLKLRERQEEWDRVRRNVELARAALTVAEAEHKQLKARPTPDEVAVATAKLEAMKLRNEEAKRKGQDVDLAKAELALALAEFDKVKRGASAEDLAAFAAREAQARAALEAAEAERRLVETPPAPKALPDKEIEAVEKSLTTAKAREAEKREALEKLRREAESAEVKAADAAVEQAEETLKILKRNREAYGDFKDAEGKTQSGGLRAPFDGLITKRLVESGALLQPFEEVLWMIDFTKKRVRAEFDVVHLQSLTKPGLKATVKSRAFGKEELAASVVAVKNVRTRNLLLDDPAAPKGGEVAEVVLEIDPPTEEPKKPIFALLRPGLRVEMDVVLELRTGAVSVPKSYVATEMNEDGSEAQYVWKVDADAKGPKRKHPVKCGMRDEYFVEIVEGLRVNDLVVKPKPQGN